MQNLHEYAGNMHMHTPYSDGSGYHAEIAEAALQAGLDYIIITDHDVWVNGMQGMYGRRPDRRLLVLIGEEVHDMRRDPQSNHLLVFGAEAELAQCASEPQALIDAVRERGGICFLAHPVEVPAPAFHEPEISWVDWDIEGFTGIELWNYMSEFKSHLTSKVAGLRAALNPARFISGPAKETLALWDGLLRQGQKVYAIGNSDAHANRYSLGPIKRVIFPYEFLFRCVNTHILTPHQFNGEYEHDRQIVLNALANGSCFVGYDLPAPTRGFRFSAQGHRSFASMGGRIRMGHGVTLQVACPQVCDIRLLRDGEVVDREKDATHRTYTATKPGVYRVEAYINFKGRSRGWIYSNPIWVVD